MEQESRCRDRGPWSGQGLGPIPHSRPFLPEGRAGRWAQGGKVAGRGPGQHSRPSLAKGEVMLLSFGVLTRVSEAGLVVMTE